MADTIIGSHNVMIAIGIPVFFSCRDATAVRSAVVCLVLRGRLVTRHCATEQRAGHALICRHVQVLVSGNSPRKIFSKIPIMRVSMISRKNSMSGMLRNVL